MSRTSHARRATPPTARRKDLLTLLHLEHSQAAYRADFALYGLAVPMLALFVLIDGPREQWPASLAFTVLGLGAWTLIEYALHRFVLHGIEPFRGWHAEHHQRPTALICAPTPLSATLIFLLVFVPSWLLGGLWCACALTLGVLAGYLVYAITHHATHHWRANITWLVQRKRWHALHHHAAQGACCYGVTSGFWDHVFATGAHRAPTP